MWDLPRYRPPFYRRTWFLSVLTFFAAVLVVAGIWLAIEKDKWDKRARTFDYKKLEEMESASTIYDRNSQILGRIYIQNREKVAADQLSPWLYKAAVAAEDNRFYQHSGV